MLIGNLTTRDKSKTVKSITYNHEGKFIEVVFTDGYKDIYPYQGGNILYRHLDKISNSDIVKA